MNVPFFGLDRQYKQIGEELITASHEVLKLGQFIDGPHTHKFESWLSLKTGYQYAVTVHSGTQALEIMARAHAQTSGGIIPVVLIPELTYIATLNALLTAGYQVSIQPVDQNGIFDYQGIKNIEAWLDHVCPVGLFGAPVSGLRNRFDFVDGAQHWLVHDPDISYSMSVSFDPTKNLPSSGNGGAILTNQRDIYEFSLAVRDNSKFLMDSWETEIIGTNSKLSEQDCAHLLVRTKYLDAWQKRRREIRLYYLDRFKDLNFRCLSRDFPVHADQKFAIYTPTNRDDLQLFLGDAGIETRIHYKSTISEHPIAKNIENKPDMLSTGTMLSRGLLSLPIFPEMTDTEVEYVADRVRNFF